MKKMALLSCMLLLACGSGNPGTDASNNAPTILESTLRDSIGIEIGDSCYVFGWIQSACFDMEGDILVLDRAACRVSRYSADGGFVGSFGRRGSGPGELMNPLDMYVTEDGRVMVCSPWSGGLHAFSMDGEWLGLVTPFLNNPPMQLRGADGSAFIAIRFSVQEVGDELECRVLIGRYEEGDEEPSVIYWENSFPFDPTDITHMLRNSLYGFVFTADRQGNVFLAHLSPDYIVEGFRAGGERFLTIERECPPVNKTPEEIQEEKEWIEGYLSSVGASGVVISFTPDPCRDAIAEVETDGMERLWIRRGTVAEPVFDVYDYDGNQLFTVNMPAMDGTVWDYCFGPDAVVAYPLNPVEWQKLYIIDYPHPAE